MDINTRMMIGEIKKQMTIKGWRHADLAQATGYSIDAIRAYMMGRSNSDRLTCAIMVALDMR